LKENKYSTRVYKNNESPFIFPGRESSHQLPQLGSVVTMSNYSKLNSNNGSLGSLTHVEDIDNADHGASNTGLGLFRSSSGSTDLKRPLTSPDLESGGHDDDPFYVFREDLYRKLDLVDESLQEYLRIVYQTVRSSTPRFTRLCLVTGYLFLYVLTSSFSLGFVGQYL
jgi:hypothetical protein